MTHFGVISLFPEQIEQLGKFGVVGRGVQAGHVGLTCFNPRDFANDKHRTVDDRPFGGGPGMVMRFEPWAGAIRAAKAKFPDAKCVALTPQGRPFDQATARRCADRASVILVAGRYEGFDERIIEAEVDEEWSLGDFVLSGGELAAMAIMDCVARLTPGVLGHEASAVEDSFSEGLLDFPHYTRPPEIEGRIAPAVLLSGDHAAIARWRRSQALGRTWLRRPDLIAAMTLSDEDVALLAEFKVTFGNECPDIE